MRCFLTYALLPIVAGLASGSSLDSIRSLPGELQPNSIVISDSAGNLYLGGSTMQVAEGHQVGPGAKITKLSSDGKIVFSTALTQDNSSFIGGLAMAPDGSILAVGTTVNGGLAVTKDAEHPQPAGITTGFFAHLDAAGKVIYASYLNRRVDFSAITSDNQGAAYITGYGALQTTPYFTMKLDSSGKQAWTTDTIGGQAIAIDAHGSVYVSGARFAQEPLPVTPGAFQPAVSDHACSGSFLIGSPCSYQYIAKLDPKGTQLIYCTWLSGPYGANPSSLLVDSDGNAILAGTTQSSDYPVTDSAYQTVDFASPPSSAINQGPCCFNSGPPYTGYVTKLNAGGTGLIFSTFLGGSEQDGVEGAALDAEGNIYLAGHASSPDFPGVPGIPDNCKAGVPYQMPYMTRLGSDGSSLTGTQLGYGAVYAQGFSFTAGGPQPLFAQAAFDGHGRASVLFNGFIANLNLFGKTENFTCATDAADHAPLAQISPGQLLTLYGNHIGIPGGLNVQPNNGVFPSSLSDRSSVKIHGIPAPILYTSDNQINMQVPYEIAGQTSVSLEIDDPSGMIAGTQQFEVAASQPSAFLTPSYDACKTVLPAGFPVLAINADGSVNGCGNPAKVGSNVTIFVNSLGLADANPVTGAVAKAPAFPLGVPVTVSGQATFVSAASAPGSTNSVWAVTVKVIDYSQSTGFPSYPFSLSIGGVPLRDSIAVWATN